MGKTYSKAAANLRNAVHPHVRGENIVPKEIDIAVNGSPPRAWGKLHRVLTLLVQKTVHPHVRGENPSFQAYSNTFFNLFILLSLP